MCVLLKIDSGISRALFIAAKTFNPFTPGLKQRGVCDCVHSDKRMKKESLNESRMEKEDERNVNLMH